MVLVVRSECPMREMISDVDAYKERLVISRISKIPGLVELSGC